MFRPQRPQFSLDARRQSSEVARLQIEEKRKAIDLMADKPTITLGNPIEVETAELEKLEEVDKTLEMDKTQEVVDRVVGCIKVVQELDVSDTLVLTAPPDHDYSNPTPAERLKSLTQLRNAMHEFINAWQLARTERASHRAWLDVDYGYYNFALLKYYHEHPTPPWNQCSMLLASHDGNYEYGQDETGAGDSSSSDND